ncbi:uncharacterized protein LOC108915301 [Anoplophora glabripennis]|uniref:uncharacterized protein LOC108915301 n=1 Tax=Anoplophora glabripennis TaxID=217634 RepID=UPI000C7593F4|nr:uncharacterized protein LOC108915301 [Anoplophora glabripennis]
MASQYNYKIKLSEWGLDTFIENFEAEGIDDESFNLLDDQTIKALIPKVGPRLIFKNRFKTFLDESQQASILTYVLDREYWSDENISGQNNTPIIIDDISDAPLKRKKPDTFTSPFPQDLQAVLNKYPDGQLVLIKKDKLTNDLRSKLTKVIITELFAIYGTEIRAEIFVKAAEEIETLFTSEIKETYYSSANKTGPRGKLYTKYINTKAALKLANNSLATTSQKGKETVSPSPENSDKDLQYMSFLKVATEPIHKIFEAWEETFKIRRRKYIHSKLNEIYGDFPCLKNNSGLDLIETDFNKRFPESTDIIYRTWSQVSCGILAEAKERNINLFHSAEIDQVAQTLLVLPFLFSPVTIKRSSKGKNWRPSRNEVQESFFFHVQNLDELQLKIASRKDKLNQFGLTLQPFGVISGELNKPSYIVVVDDVQYIVDTGIRALELLYKLFHALDVEYPHESEPLWLFLQELVFKMKPQKICPSTVSMVSDISYHLKEVDNA